MLHRNRKAAAGARRELGQGPSSSSQACIASLEAAGVLPDSKGLRLTAEQRQRRLQARKSQQQLAADAAAAMDSHAALAALQARRQLFDGMEQSLREQGLGLGESHRELACSLP